MSEVQQLYRLQVIDSELKEKKERLGEVLSALKGPQALQEAIAKFEEATTTLNEWEQKRKKVNAELDSVNSKQKKSSDRLYSGKVKNPKELTDLQEGIESLKRRASSLEDDLLEVMMMVEESEVALTAVTQKRDLLQAKWDEDKVTLEGEKNSLALRLHELITKRKQNVSQINERLVKDYTRLSQKKNGVAVARLRADMCLGCRMTVSANTQRLAQQGKMIHCENCGRIVVPA